MSRPARTRWTVLGCLSIEPMSGYDIKRFIDRTIVHFWSESYGQLYPTLKKLEREGLVTSRAEPGERGPERRVYSITRKGCSALREWLRHPAEPASPRYEHSLKLFFGHVAGSEVALEHVERLRAEATASLEAYRGSEARLEVMRGEAPWIPYWLAVLRGGIRYAEMTLGWCDDTEAELTGLSSEDA